MFLTLTDVVSECDFPIGTSRRQIQPGPSTEGDLATALHRLVRRQNYLSEKQFFAEEWQRKIQVLADQRRG